MMIDNFGLYDMHEREAMRAAKYRPKCDICEDTIWEDHAYRIGEYLVCENCMENSKEYIGEEY